MRSLSAVVVLVLLSTPLGAGEQPGAHPRVGSGAQARRITWMDVEAIHGRLASRGITEIGFGALVERLAVDNARRVRVGDLDHLIFYLLQSQAFTNEPPVEPAVSARALVEALGGPAREAFLADPSSAAFAVGRPVRARIDALVNAIEAPGSDARLAYFASLVAAMAPDRDTRVQALVGEYVRVMRFVHEKEFGAGRSSTSAVADLYRARGLSTDTATEAGFLVSQGLGVLRALDDSRRVRRVLIVGAGLDLAPRTGMLEHAPPQSYQPWAVLDALVGLGLSSIDDVEVVAADINPRVVAHLHEFAATAPRLDLMSGLGSTRGVTLSADYREYFGLLGRAIGSEPRAGRVTGVPPGHLHKRLQVSADAARAVRAVRLDVVTERFDDQRFDLVVATNVLPYFDDEALMLAIGNVAAMLGPAGVFLHNEPRPLVHEVAAVVGLAPVQSRHAVIATVEGAAPLGDSVWLHARRRVVAPGP